MTGLAISVDRVVVFVVGGVLIAVGAGALLWNTGLIPGFPQVFTAPALTGAISTWWWRWAVAGAGVACVAVALRWLAAHRPAGKAASIRLHDSDTPGTLTVDPATVAVAAAAALQQHPGVRSARGKAVTDRGVRTVELAVTAAHPSDLDALIEAIDITCADLASATSGAPVAARATIHVKGGRALTRPRLE
jgi:hypothetical protein